MILPRKEISEYIIDQAVQSYAGRKDGVFNAANCSKALERVSDPTLKAALTQVLLEVGEAVPAALIPWRSTVIPMLSPA